MSKSLCLKLLQNKKIKVSYKNELQKWVYSTEVEGKMFVNPDTARRQDCAVLADQHFLGSQVQVKDDLGVRHGFFIYEKREISRFS